MTRPDLRRQRTLYLAMHIALGGALLSLIPSALAADAPNTLNHRISCSARCLAMYKAPNSFPIRKPSPMPCPRGIP